MKTILRFLIGALVIGAVVAVGWTQFGQAPTDASAQVATPDDDIIDQYSVEQRNLLVTVSATGSVTPMRQVVLGFELSAPVVEILVSEGDRVLAGAPLARIDASDFQAALDDARAAYEQQRVSYEALLDPAREVDIAAAEAAVNTALASAAAAAQGASSQEIEIARMQSELARNQLWQQQIQRDQTMAIPPEFRARGAPGQYTQEIQLNSGLEQAEYSVTVSDVTLNGVENRGPDLGSLASANAQLIQAQVALDRLVNGVDETTLQQAEIGLETVELALDQAQATLDKTTLFAPFDGVIAQQNLVIGELPPRDGAPLLLLDDSAYYVELSIDETDVVDLQPGQRVELRLDALGDAEITGTIERISVTPVKLGQLVTYPVRVLLDATDAPVRTGMTATAVIVVNDLPDVVIVPNRFIRIERATGNAFVSVRAEDDSFVERQVVLGLRNETESQIVSGLTAGETIYLLPRSSFSILGG